MKSAATVDEYMAAIPEPHHALLEHLRSIIKATCPQAEEKMSYGIPAFKYHGMLVYYGAFTKHCSLFPGSVATAENFRDELADYTLTKGSIHFTVSKPLPDSLVVRLVKARMAENEARKRKT